MGCGQLRCKQERKKQLRFSGTTSCDQRMYKADRLYESRWLIPFTSYLDQVARTDTAQ